MQASPSQAARSQSAGCAARSVRIFVTRVLDAADAEAVALNACRGCAPPVERAITVVAHREETDVARIDVSAGLGDRVGRGPAEISAAPDPLGDTASVINTD